MAKIDRLIEEATLEYLTHRVEDLQYIWRIFDTYKWDRIFQALSLLLKCRDPEKFYAAALFVQDSVRCFKGSAQLRYRRALYRSAAVDALEQQCSSTNCFRRVNAFYVLGKIGSRKSLPVMVASFRRYMNSDPLNIPKYYFEISWLRQKPYWKLFRMARESKSWFTRWACISIISQHSTSSAYTRYLKLLLQDPNSYIQSNAHFELKRLKQRDSSFKLKSKLTLEELQQITFDDLHIWFVNWMCETHKTSYTLSELKQFVEKKLTALHRERLKYYGKISKEKAYKNDL